MKLRMLFVAVVLAVSVSQPFAATITVTSTNDSGPGSLRDALANAADGDTITCSVTGTISLANGALVVSNSVSIVGPGYNTLTVIGQSDRGFRISPSKTVGLSGLGISSAGQLAVGGGGIYNDHATLILTNCSVGGIFTTSPGGAIYNDGSGGSATLRIAYCLINGNTASAGAAIYNDGSSAGSATLEIASSTVSRDSTIYIGSGGGVINDGTSGRAIVMVSDSTFYANIALGGVGGGILNEGSGGTAIVQIANCTFDENEGQGGGAIYNSGSEGTATVEIDNTILVALAPGVNIFNDSGTVTSLGYNLSSDDGGGFLSAMGDQINTDPTLDLAGPQDNGGLTPTIALEPGSPAINAGNPTFPI